MNKKNVLWLCALLLLAVGMSSCSSDDEKIVGSGEIIIPDEIPENSLLILSDKGEISWGECYKSGEMYNPPHCYLGGEITFENDTIYHMGFGANIKGSDVFFILTIGFQSNRQMSFNDLKEGDTYSVSAPLFTAGDPGLGTLIELCSTLEDDRYDQHAAVHYQLWNGRAPAAFVRDDG